MPLLTEVRPFTIRSRGFAGPFLHQDVPSAPVDQSTP
jgi:hypothetical protein